MFVSLPEYKFFIPPELAPPEATYWRTLGLSSHAAWYVLSVRTREPEACLDTFLLVWDSDVVDAINSISADVESLLVVAPHVGGRGRGWFSKQIREIWRGIEPDEEGGNPCVVMVDDDGAAYSGLFMQERAGVTRHELVARVGSKAKRKTRAAQA